jgi:hypothetical protein
LRHAGVTLAGPREVSCLKLYGVFAKINKTAELDARLIIDVNNSLRSAVKVVADINREPTV